MQTFIAAFVLLLTLVVLMSVGYIFKRKSMASSCGGISSLGMKKVCDCDDPCDNRKAKMAKEEQKRKMLEENRII
ncbi:(Na+)-NQR maturation NqrM [Paraferrimonas sp. SM1919]|uniref:(Na+)-NQR maturation NqrM n=1 Tax=Paraferrimonas sp. SM1919 TaxID=2662263 RepID=UPI0013D19A06|nr:(Na+)-NQR maturation NqrM [Paraferrimonas sp. SM1919]